MEDREPEEMPAQSYNMVKRMAEKFFAYHAEASGGKWTAITACHLRTAGQTVIEWRCGWH